MYKYNRIAYKTKRIDRDFRYMYGMLNGTGQGAGTPASTAQSVAVSEQVVVPVGAVDDEFYDIVVIPWDMDRTEPLRWRLVYTNTTTSGFTATYTFDYMARAEGEAMLDITTHESTTYSGSITATANALNVTDWTITTSEDYITSTDILLLTRLTATNLGGSTTTADEMELITLQLEYTIKSTASDGHNHDTDDAPV